jgi:hypothetical protein
MFDGTFSNNEMSYYGSSPVQLKPYVTNTYLIASTLMLTANNMTKFKMGRVAVVCPK